MPVDFEKLKDSPRILIEAVLKPVAGTRIQPTGFPDLGAAVFDAPDGKGGTVPTLIVESAQSMANRLEAVCWDEATDGLVPELQGLPYVRVKLAGFGDGTDTTSSILEFHRLNSPYIMQKDKDSTRSMTVKGEWFREVFTTELGLGRVAVQADSGDEGDASDVPGVINLRKLAQICFKYDPNCLVHGVFLEKIAGRLRHPRALSAFIEGSGVNRADSGGVKFDRAMPKPLKGLDAAGGYGNVPFHRTEFTADQITAYFSLDLAQLRGYGLPPEAYKLLVVLSLWKVRKFLDSNMRLRSACELDLAVEGVVLRFKNTERKGQEAPLDPAGELEQQLRDLIGACRPHFADPTITELTWNPKAGTEGQVVIELPPDFPPPKAFKEPVKSLAEFKKKTAKAPPKLILKKGLSEDVVTQIEETLGKDDNVSKAVRAKLDGIEATSTDGKE